MTIKNTSGEETSTETMTDRLRNVQMEGWQKLKYVGEEDDAAWELYNKTLHYAPALENDADDSKDTKADTKGKGKATENAATEAAQQKLQLGVKWGEDDFLHAVAGKDRIGVLEGYGSTVLPGIKAEEEALVLKKEEDTETSTAGVRRAPAARGAAGSAAPPASAAARGRGKAPTTAASVMAAAKRGGKK